MTDQPQDPSPEPTPAPNASPPADWNQPPASGGPPAADPYGLGKSSIGVAPNVGAGLCYIVWVVALVFFLIEKESKFVKFHAFQALIMPFIVGIPAGILAVVLGLIPGVGLILMFVLYFGLFALWIYLVIGAFTGKWTKIPIVGEIASKQAGL